MIAVKKIIKLIMNKKNIKYLIIPLLAFIYYKILNNFPFGTSFGVFLDNNLWIKPILMIVIISSFLFNILKDCKNRD